MNNSNLWEACPSYRAINAQTDSLKAKTFQTTRVRVKLKLIILLLMVYHSSWTQNCNQLQVDAGGFHLSTSVVALPPASADDWRIDLYLDDDGGNVEGLMGYQIALPVYYLSSLSDYASVSGDWSESWCVDSAVYQGKTWLNPGMDTIHVHLRLDSCASRFGKGLIGSVYLSDPKGDIQGNALIDGGGGIILIENINGRTRPNATGSNVTDSNATGSNATSSNPTLLLEESAPPVLYPNPARSVIYLDTKGKEIVRIRILDMAGQIIREIPMAGQFMSGFPATDQPTGGLSPTGQPGGGLSPTNQPGGGLSPTNQARTISLAGLPPGLVLFQLIGSDGTHRMIKVLILEN